MAIMQVTEFSDMAEDAQGRAVPVGLLNADVTNQSVTFTTSTQSSEFQKTTRFIRVIADADAHVLVGASPTATTTHTRVEANVAEYFAVQKKGETGHKVAAVAA